MTDMDTLLADLNNDVPPMTDEAFAKGRARLRRGMTPSRPSRHLRVLVAAAVAAALAVASAVLVAQRPDEPAPPVGSASGLAEWAKTLADDPPRVGPGQYLYERITSTQWQDLDADPRFRLKTTSTGEQWIPHDYRDEWRVVHGEEHVEFVKGTEKDALAEGLTIPPGSPAVDMTARCGKYVPNDTPCDGEGWGTTGSPAFYAGLTGDPRRLYEILADRARDNGDGTGLGIFTEADRLLQPNVPNDFKATLFQAMSRIPGLMVVDEAHTLDGRTGIGVRIEADGTTREQILDRTTGDLLQGRFTDAHKDVVGTVTYGVSDELGERPA